MLVEGTYADPLHDGCTRKITSVGGAAGRYVISGVYKEDEVGANKDLLGTSWTAYMTCLFTSRDHTVSLFFVDFCDKDGHDGEAHDDLFAIYVLANKQLTWQDSNQWTFTPP